MHHYKVEFSDKNKQPIRVPYKSVDKSTSLQLPGKWCKQGSQYIVNSLVSLLSNHNSNRIDNPVEGQTWFNNESNTINVFDGDNWFQLGTVRPPIFSSDVANHIDLENSIENYLTNKGGTMSGPLLLDNLTDLSSNYSAVNKDYIDQIVGNEYYNLLRMDGNDDNPMTGSLILPDKTINNKHQIIPKKVALKTVVTLNNTRDKNIVGKTSKYDAHINVTSVLSPNNSLKITFITGVAYLSRLENYKDIDLTSVDLLKNSVIKNLTVHTNIVGENRCKMQCEGRGIDDNKTIRIIRYQKDASTIDTTIYFIAIGYLYDDKIKYVIEAPKVIPEPDYVPVYRKTTVSLPVETPEPSPSPSESMIPAPSPSTSTMPVPSPSVSESPTPSPSVSASPGPTPSPSPSPSVSVSPGPSPSPSPSASKPGPSPSPSASAMMTKDCRDDSNVTMIDGAATATGSAGYKVITGNKGTITLTYDPKSSPDRFDLRNSATGTTLASTGTAQNASKPGTLTCSSSQVFAGNILAIVVTSSDKNNIDFSYCIEYAGGLTKVS